MKHAIFTASDSKYGDFLVNHWLASLKDNVNLKNMDIIILDYGLTKEQVSRIKGAIVYKCVKDGYITSIRFRDMARFLNKHKYDQILSTDGGDIIFQTDLKDVFEKDKTEFRAACEDFSLPFQKIFSDEFFTKKNAKKIKDFLKGKKMINAGVLFAPCGKFKKLCKECCGLIINKSKFGPDQVAVNYILYRDGFKLLNSTYNFVITTTKYKFFIKEGVFYLNNKEKVAIVHNAGNKSFKRPIKNFGYGKGYNKIKVGMLIFSRIFIRLANIFLGK